MDEILGIFNADSIISHGGLFIVFLAVFAQTGLFFCFFLPSGALLFTSGVFVASGQLGYNIFTVCGILILAPVVGNLTGYWFGWKTGPLLYRKKESKFFSKRHLNTAESFYHKYGGIALMAGLFFPIIRTFGPIVAGLLKLNFPRFCLFTLIGSILWITSFVLAGYFLASFPFLKPYLKYIIIGIIVFVTVPIVIRIIRQFNKVST